MSELLPCPFCGGEAHISASSDGYGVECWNRSCIDMQMEEIPTEAEAIAAWNTRAERTCKVAACYSPSDFGSEDEWYFAFSCGCELYWDEAIPPNYCPNCGAKVVN